MICFYFLLPVAYLRIEDSVVLGQALVPPSSSSFLLFSPCVVVFLPPLPTIGSVLSCELHTFLLLPLITCKTKGTVLKDLEKAVCLHRTLNGSTLIACLCSFGVRLLSTCFRGESNNQHFSSIRTFASPTWTLFFNYFSLNSSFYCIHERLKIHKGRKGEG